MRRFATRTGSSVGRTASTYRARDDRHGRLLADYRDRFPDVRAECQAIVLAGPPGAGKSSVLEEVLGADRSGWLVVDADELKRALLTEAIRDGSYDHSTVPAEVRAAEAAGERFFPLELASLVNEESSRLATRLRQEAIRDGMNIVIDTVLSSPEKAVELGQRLASAGYRVEVVDVEVPFAVSEARIATRWQESYQCALDGADELGGRMGAREYARGVYAGPDGRHLPHRHPHPPPPAPPSPASAATSPPPKVSPARSSSTNPAPHPARPSSTHTSPAHG